MAKKNKNLPKQYLDAKSAKVGSVIKCAYCGTEFVKKYYQETFCCPKCKDDFWNERGDRHKQGKRYYREYNMKHPERLERIGIDLEKINDPLNYMRDEDFDYCDW